jgi:methylaspartate ammonia-lyase
MVEVMRDVGINERSNREWFRWLSERKVGRGDDDQGSYHPE